MNAVSSRDEKEALEQAKQMVIEMDNKVKESERQLASIQTTLLKAAESEQRALKAEADLKAANTRAATAEQRAQLAEAKLEQINERQMLAQKQAAMAAAARPQVLATHKITSTETLSHLALQYYGHATEPYWRLIYEVNKDKIGSNPNKVRVGTELEIPVLPESLK
jgi:nucleoid-associated protein YgaU